MAIRPRKREEGEGDEPAAATVPKRIGMPAAAPTVDTNYVQDVREPQPTPTPTLLRPFPASDAPATPETTDAAPATVNYGQGRVMPLEEGLTAEQAPPSDGQEQLADVPPLLPTAEEYYRRKDEDYRSLKGAPIEKSSRWKSAAISGLLGLQAFSQRPIRDWNDFAQAAAQAGTFGAAGLFDKKLGNQMKRDAQLDRARADRDEAFATYKDDLNARAAETNIRNNDLKPTLAREKLQNQVLRDQNKFEQKLKLLEEKARLDGNKYELFTDEQTGRVMMRFPSDSSKPPVPFRDESGSELYAPSKKVYEYETPSGQRVQATGGQILNADSRYEMANANIQNTAQRENIDAETRYQQEVQEYQDKQSQLVAKSTAAFNLASDAQQDLNALIASIQNQGYPATSQQQSEMSKLRQTIRERQAESTQAMDEARLLRAPTRPRTYTPQTLKPGKIVPRSKDPLGLYQ